MTTTKTTTTRMDDARYLLAVLRRRGYTLSLAGEGLTVQPGRQLTDGERDEIREYKGELMVLLFEGV